MVTMSSRVGGLNSSIDMMSLDPVFVAEFAEAGSLADVPSSYKADFTKDIVKPAVVASTWKNKLVAAPFWANTQLLWYRKSVAKAQGLDMSKPVTWQQLIDAGRIPGPHTTENASTPASAEGSAGIGARASTSERVSSESS